MPLRWDPLLVRHLAAELDHRLAGGKVRALRLDGKNRTLVLLLREATLAWSLHPGAGAPAVLPPADPAPGDLPLPGRIRAVRAVADERILIFEILPARGRGARDLVVELLGNQWNAMVVDRPSDTLRHVLVRREGPRPVRVGLPYTPPPPASREGRDAPLSLDRWLALVEPEPPPQRRRALVASVAWTSPLNAPALVDGDPDPHQALVRGHALWLHLAFEDLPPEPVLLDTARGPQPYPWPLPGLPSQRYPTLLDAFAAFAAFAAAAEAAADTEAGAPDRSPGDGLLFPARLLERLESAVDGAGRRRTRVEAELASLEDEASLRAQGDLLLARFPQVPPGARTITLTGFDGEEVRVSLDPTLSVQDNANALYERAGKVARARARLPGLLEEARRELERLETLLARVRDGEAEPDEVERALPEARTPTASGSAPSLPYRVYRSSGGLEIRVGRGARHNDALTFHHSAPDDVWLHARHAAGAHVILRWPNPGNPPARDLGEAAVLAAVHSKARTSGSVPVDWTRRKYVRKPRGAPPGTVLPQRIRTLMVQPDATLVERLSAE